MAAEALKKTRSTKKGLMTRESKNIEMCVEERDDNDVTSLRKKLIDLFRSFRDSHNAYHATLTDDNELESSHTYYESVQDDYKSYLKKLNACLAELKQCIWLRCRAMLHNQ